MIDWKVQWEIHGYCYKEGHVHVDLSEFGCDSIMKLAPGPGFGDLSHPTTWLVLRMMVSNLSKKNVLDIGCGSGVLSVAAAMLGANTVYGIDIDVEAVKHAESNAILNNVDSKTSFGLPDTFRSEDGDLIVVMNMIRSEQSVAWNSIQCLDSIHGEIFTSGILKEELDLYLNQTKEWHWELKSVIEDRGWLGLHFQF